MNVKKMCKMSLLLFGIILENSLFISIYEQLKLVESLKKGLKITLKVLQITLSFDFCYYMRLSCFKHKLM